MTEQRKETVLEITQKIREDPLSCDLQLSLFASALQSYRYDTVLRPYPPSFFKWDREKDKSALLKVFEKIPKVSTIIPKISSLSNDALDLLKWVLDSKRFSLKTLEAENFKMIKALTGNSTPVPAPNYIFEIMPSKSSDLKFQEKRQSRKVFHAFHGSRTENFHSILNNGLASHMNKTSVFGEGTYLSGELSLSLNYSPSSLTWSKSNLGNMIGCVAVGEIIDDPTVKCQVGEINGVKNKSRGSAKNSMAGDVPDKYYIVQNNEVIRVKYILVYVDGTSHQQRSTQPTFFQQHKFGIMIFFYAFLLVAVGLANSKIFKHHLKRLLK